jgi:hypothetical protein
MKDVQICNRCVLDEKVSLIEFDEKGECNFCKIHDENVKKYPTGVAGQNILNSILEEIKTRGQKRL